MEISYKVVKEMEGSDYVFYKITCACHSDDHNLSVEFEYDKETSGFMYINFNKTLAWCSAWGCTSWIQRVCKRVKASLRMLFTGYIDIEESFIIDGVDHIDSFIAALQEGKQKMLDHQEKLSSEK